MRFSEKRRLYEWIFEMFIEQLSNRACIPNDGFDIIRTLKTKLVSNETLDKNDDDQPDEQGATEARSTSSSVPKISLGNVFILGRQKMIEMKIPLVRERKQNRILRSRAFFLDINDTVIKMEEDIDVQLDRITNVTLFDPWYRTAYRAISN